MSALIVIPARGASTRLPGKMLADISGKPLIVRTYQSVVAANVGDVVVACDGDEIASVIRNAGGTAILTDPNLPSGSDRVYAACKEYDPNGKYKFVINVQGDMPFVAAEFIQKSHEVLLKSNCDISTIATPINDDSYLKESVVKPVIAFYEKNSGKALYFSRSPVPFGGPYYHHVGIYGFKTESLERFISLPQGILEQAEKLEQLRALENSMTIGIDVVDIDQPISVDTPADLEFARQWYLQQGDTG
ncbi:3-deoxy-manno-octulosonate cytidylyltransferase [Alphaproteobacteria bacterium]|nr:3-deoxy-manno-octulosonate cytidylyltransferase [Alphaproteobacteria bacterium]